MMDLSNIVINYLEVVRRMRGRWTRAGRIMRVEAESEAGFPIEAFGNDKWGGFCGND